MYFFDRDEEIKRECDGRKGKKEIEKEREREREIPGALLHHS